MPYALASSGSLILLPEGISPSTIASRSSEKMRSGIVALGSTAGDAADTPVHSGLRITHVA